MAAVTRDDGRGAESLRAMRGERGLLVRPDGSARYVVARTIVVAAVYGPVEAKRRLEVVDGALLEVHVRPPAGVPGPAERSVEGLLHGIFSHAIITTLYPRAAVSIIVQIMNDDGAVLAACVTAAALALADAGVAVRYLPAAACAGLVRLEEGDVVAILDPTSAEESQAVATVSVVCEPASGKVVFEWAEGRFTGTSLDEARRLAQGACAAVGELMRRALLEVPEAPTGASRPGAQGAGTSRTRQTEEDKDPPEVAS